MKAAGVLVLITYEREPAYTIAHKYPYVLVE